MSSQISCQLGESIVIGAIHQCFVELLVCVQGAFAYSPSLSVCPHAAAVAMLCLLQYKSRGLRIRTLAGMFYTLPLLVQDSRLLYQACQVSTLACALRKLITLLEMNRLLHLICRACAQVLMYVHAVVRRATGTLIAAVPSWQGKQHRTCRS